MQTDQSAHFVLDAKHDFIASAVQLVNNPDQFVALAGEALEVARTRIGLCVRRRTGFRRVFSFSLHRSSLHLFAPGASGRNDRIRTVSLPFGGESMANGLNSG